MTIKIISFARNAFGNECAPARWLAFAKVRTRLELVFADLTYSIGLPLRTTGIGGAELWSGLANLVHNFMGLIFLAGPRGMF